MEPLTERIALVRTTETSREDINLQQRTLEKESKELQQWKVNPEERRGSGHTDLKRRRLQRLLFQPC